MVLAAILYGIGILLGLFVLELLLVALLPGFDLPPQPLKRAPGPAEEAAPAPASREDVRFFVGETALSAWLYLPEHVPPPYPCIVMGNGLGGTRDAGLEPYAVRFRDAGFAVLAFDYRYFGASEGEPRQLIWIPAQLEDWSAAVACARGVEEVDPARVALWGTSLAGGHVIVTAARDPAIACVAAQVPGMDGRASALASFRRMGVGRSVRMILHGQRDLVRSRLGLSPHRIPIVGRPGGIALIHAPEAFDSFAALAPEDYVNEACARIIIRGDKYRPIEYARHVRCPVLLQICDHDTLTPIRAAEETAAILGDLAEVKRYPLDHFAIYTGDGFELGVRDQVAFFRRHL
ncbi:MAG: alpha/beta hydrolase [Methanomicrobiaceae archaeon]|uniref:Xaa-Pro dipeptidyl-peptidase-like domain-containing protein n=1 Tax=hydrocarbon metagenome TaxID=938273 RepID=A0A0W8FGF9_9ZZZZ|nr:alpha/beta hydrolase [Methanomicrobiaceae archaeon]